MNFSTVNEISQSRSLTSAFLGYNHNEQISDGEFYDMENLTSTYYPVLSPRQARGSFSYGTSGTHYTRGIIAKDALCYVDGTSLYINNYAVTGLTLTATDKQLISMGAYLIIMPDKKYINTKNLTEYGDIEASFTTSSTVTYTMCNIDGDAYTNVSVQATAPSDPANGAYWIDTSVSPHTLKVYSSSSAVWTPVATTYIKISHANIASAFKQYDAVKISGMDTTNIPQLKDLEGQTSVLWQAYHDPGATGRSAGTNDYVVVVGILDEVKTQSGAVTLARTMPAMDFITESENRLWGCRYGTDSTGSVVNEIYACKQGDFKNWNCFMGLSTDSYAASVGSDGAFTGAVTHLGYPVFFKENCLHKVYGSQPSNYQIQTTACRGVMKGAGRSLAIVNETLYYKSRNGVCAYDGSLPSEISSAFGNIHYSAVDTAVSDTLRNGAVAGSHGNKYYISMKSEKDSQWHLFLYDASLGLWHREDNTRADAFCSCDGEMYYIDNATHTIKTVFGSGTADTALTEWMAETGVLGTDSPDRKYISRLLVRLSLTIGARVMFYIQYDSCGEWEHMATMTGTTLRSFSFPIRPKRCDHFRLRIIGKGEAKIYSVTKTIEEGSDI